jgi:hypothetical protein
MRCTIRLTTAQDIANVVIGHEAWSQDVDQPGRDCVDALLDACAISRQVWTAAYSEGEPLAFIGAAPWPQDSSRGRLWFVILAAYDGNDADLTSIMQLTVAEMLQVFARLENHVSTEKAWALELMREAGFAVEPAHTSADGVCRHRVWIDAGAPAGTFANA